MVNHSQKIEDDIDISGFQVDSKNLKETANRADGSANIINPSKLLEDYYDEANDSDYADEEEETNIDKTIGKPMLNPIGLD